MNASTVPVRAKHRALDARPGEHVGRWLVIESKPGVLRLVGGLRPIVYIRASCNAMDDFGRHHTLHTSGWFGGNDTLEQVLDYWGDLKLEELRTFDDD